VSEKYCENKKVLSEKNSEECSRLLSVNINGSLDIQHIIKVPNDFHKTFYLNDGTAIIKFEKKQGTNQLVTTNFDNRILIFSFRKNYEEVYLKRLLSSFYGVMKFVCKKNESEVDLSHLSSNSIIAQNRENDLLKYYIVFKNNEYINFSYIENNKKIQKNIKFSNYKFNI